MRTSPFLVAVVGERSGRDGWLVGGGEMDWKSMARDFCMDEMDNAGFGYDYPMSFSDISSLPRFDTSFIDDLPAEYSDRSGD